jgi:hypothetical protein
LIIVIKDFSISAFAFSFSLIVSSTIIFRSRSSIFVDEDSISWSSEIFEFDSFFWFDKILFWKEFFRVTNLVNMHKVNAFFIFLFSWSSFRTIYRWCFFLESFISIDKFCFRLMNAFDFFILFSWSIFYLEVEFRQELFNELVFDSVF